MDQLKVGVESSNPHVLVLTETWLRKSVSYPDINITGYNLFRQDRSTKGGGVAIYSKEHLLCSVVLAKSIPKQFDLLVIQIIKQFFHYCGRLLSPSLSPCMYL